MLWLDDIVREISLNYFHPILIQDRQLVVSIIRYLKVFKIPEENNELIRLPVFIDAYSKVVRI